MEEKKELGFRETVSKLPVGLKVLAAFLFVAMIVVGVFLLFHVRLMYILFPVVVGLIGIYLIVHYIINKSKRRAWELICGVVNVIFAALVVVANGPGATVLGGMMLDIVLAVWALFMGFYYIFDCIDKKKAGRKDWAWVLAGGIMLVACGLLMLASPLLGLVIIFTTGVIYGAFALIIMGFVGLGAVFAAKKHAEGDGADDTP